MKRFPDSDSISPAGQASAPIRILTDEELDAPIDPSAPGDLAADPSLWNGFGATIGNYELIAPIARGGQGVVIRALQKSTGKVVAVKFLPGGRFASRHAAERFDREATILAAIDHPNIVGIIDRGTTAEGAGYIVMPFVRGVDLTRRLEGLKELREIAALFAEISEAVGALHERGICHRDLKPSNIMIDRRGAPRILDFGLAVDHDPTERNEVTKTGQILGSLAWISPEQARGEASRVGPNSDVYSLGVMLYAATQGRMPYSAEGALHDVVKRICDSTATVRGTRSWRAVIRKCLEKKPSERYLTASALAADLRLLAAGQRPAIGKLRLRRVATLSVFATCIGIATAGSWVALGRSGPVPARSSSPGVIALPERLNANGMPMIQIPAGRCMLGSPSSDPAHLRNEPEHAVVFDQPFWISQTVVTEGQYSRVTGREIQPGTDPRLPATNVPWTEAKQFCAKLGKIDHHEYRLPTEDEWEYSARPQSNGLEMIEGKLDDAAWFSTNSNGVLHQVGQKAANAWGLFDIEGNCWQWCENTQSLPTTPFEARAIRGGSYTSSPRECRASYRNFAPVDVRLPDLGFRVVSK